MTWTQLIAKCIMNDDMRANLMRIPIAIIASKECIPESGFSLVFLSDKENESNKIDKFENAKLIQQIIMNYLKGEGNDIHS